MRKVEPVGHRGGLHVTALQVAAAATRPIHGRGLGLIVEGLARVFPKDLRVRAEVHHDRVMEVAIGDGYWMPALLGRPYEPEVREVLASALDPGSLFLDLGANLGYWSLFASTIIDDPSHVIAVEASPHTAALLDHNAKINNGCFTVVSAAVWNVPYEEVEIATDPIRHAWTSASNEWVEELGAMGFERLRVPTMTVDELSKSLDADNVVMKLDLEGAELEGLMGATHTLGRDCVVVFERHEREAGTEAQTLLESLGYVVMPLTQGASASSEGRNFLAARPGSRHLR